MAFTTDDYRLLLLQLLDSGYQFVDYQTVVAGKRHVIMRHDVDMSLEFARRLAQVEAEFGISAIYFVLISGSLYNPLSAESRSHLDAIAALGHQIGLHFDASIYAGDRDSLDRAVRKELSALGTLIEQPSPIISFHRPAKVLLGDGNRFGDCEHTYMPKFFKDIGYCSDSRGQWFYQHPLEHESVKAGTALQLLTHPVWWCGYRAEAPVSLLDRLTFDRMDVFRTELARNCEIYRKEILNHLSGG